MYNILSTQNKFDEESPFETSVKVQYSLLETRMKYRRINIIVMLEKFELFSLL